MKKKTPNNIWKIVKKCTIILSCRLSNLTEEENRHNAHHCRWTVETSNFIIKPRKLTITNISWFYSIRELVSTKTRLGSRYFDRRLPRLMTEPGRVEPNLSRNYEIPRPAVNAWPGGPGAGCMLVMVWTWVFPLLRISTTRVPFSFFLQKMTIITMAAMAMTHPTTIPAILRLSL